MRHLRCLVVPGALALAASVVAAGPAAAAKGGNSDNAHACQQGGHENRFEAETGRPFQTPGDCASHAARGGAISALEITNTPTYPCPPPGGTCWGTFTGSGLAVGSQWIVHNLSTGEEVNGNVDTSGSASAKLNVPCGVTVSPITFAVLAVTREGNGVTRSFQLDPPTSGC